MLLLLFLFLVYYCRGNFLASSLRFLVIVSTSNHNYKPQTTTHTYCHTTTSPPTISNAPKAKT